MGAWGYSSLWGVCSGVKKRVIGHIARKSRRNTRSGKGMDSNSVKGKASVGSRWGREGGE